MYRQHTKAGMVHAISSNTLASHEFSGMNQMFKSKWQQILPSHQLIEIIQGIVMEGFFTKSNKVLLKAKDPILMSCIVAIAFYEEMYMYQSSTYQKLKCH